MNTEKYDRIKSVLDHRILLLDGAMGTMIQHKDIDGSLRGCPDLLCVTRPEVIREIHREYLEAGSDIITTNTFGANAISLADYGMQHRAYEIAKAGAALGRLEADRAMAENPAKPRFVAGSVGPTNKTASMSSDIMNPASREITFAQLEEAYEQQIEGLLDGGADLLLIETVFDTLNAKAAVYAADKVSQRRGEKIPVMMSATVSDGSGRTLSGQTLDAFYTSVRHAGLLTVGLNCAFGPEQLLPGAMELAHSADCMMSCHPNAGLPNELGEYDETPESFAKNIRKYLEEGCVNIIGGCCGTTPKHIAAISEFIDDYHPRQVPSHTHGLNISGLEKVALASSDSDTSEADLSRDSMVKFLNIGERTNVAGSAKFARLIREGHYDEAASIAAQQIEAGAQAIDICMDDAMIDGPRAMRNFLNLLASDPRIARVPFMVDSSDWSTIEAGLQTTQGKCIINSISLKEGEEKFLEKAREIKRYGAAAVVMLFDEQGQADVYERKIKVAERSYRLLTSIGFPADDIIFDPNILTIATGMPEHDRYALDFIRATEWIRKNLPHSHVSGGVSNLSFAFRGNNRIREAMHSVFLYHAIRAGMDMAIVNSQMLKVYSEIDPDLLDRIEDLIFLRRPDATERLLEYANRVRNSQAEGAGAMEKTTETMAGNREESIEEKIRRMLIEGSDGEMRENIAGALEKYHSALDVIDKVLMPVMDEIGIMFGDGKMFLPQVIKSARVLKMAIGILSPYIGENATAEQHGQVLIATVKGDIHDIGKNIVALVVGCNGYNVVDLGVMADAKHIADETERLRPVAVMLSGLITPSLNEMVEVCRELERRGLDVPVIIGGATTSELHTALKIAPAYRGLVIHAPDASYNSRYLSRLVSPEQESFKTEVESRQAWLREEYGKKLRLKDLVTIEEARKRGETARGLAMDAGSEQSETISEFVPGRIYVMDDFPMGEVEPLIDWTYFFAGWGLKKKYPGILDDPEVGEEARKLFEDARNLLREIRENRLLRLEAVAATFQARNENEDIILTTGKGEVVLPMLREQKASKNGDCAADLVARGNGYVTLFALTAGVGLKALADRLKREGNDYKAVMAKLLADRLAEAFAGKLFPSGLRLAFGYPAVPDHTLKRDVFEILNVEGHSDMRLTSNSMINPEESICGIVLPDGEYFTIDRVGNDQLRAYASRRDISLEELREILPFYLTDERS